MHSKLNGSLKEVGEEQFKFALMKTSCSLSIWQSVFSSYLVHV